MIKSYEVKIGLTTYHVCAETRSKARYQAYLLYSKKRHLYTLSFIEFAKRVKWVRRAY